MLIYNANTTSQLKILILIVDLRLQRNSQDRRFKITEKFTLDLLTTRYEHRKILLPTTQCRMKIRDPKKLHLHKRRKENDKSYLLPTQWSWSIKSPTLTQIIHVVLIEFIKIKKTYVADYNKSHPNKSHVILSSSGYVRW